jgi:hypothetical protein
MSLLILFDVAPDPVRGGVALAVVLLVMAFVMLLVGTAALVFLLWYRKRSLRTTEMIRLEHAPATSPVQVNSPNHP